MCVCVACLADAVCAFYIIHGRILDKTGERTPTTSPPPPQVAAPPYETHTTQFKEQPDCAHTFITHTRRHTHTQNVRRRLIYRLFSRLPVFHPVLPPVEPLPAARGRRDPEPAQLGEEVPVLRRGPAVPRGHRRDLRPGQETLPEAAVGRLGRSDGGVQHRPQQRQNRYVGVSERLPFPGPVAMAAGTGSPLPDFFLVIAASCFWE